ncbi:Ig-like domain-containing protein [Flavobacterium ustbae]|uniref:Ig-like domain-containing protein n=1 Tax=Flavobacterium ustbae TaxID=2488790 RepID=UPI0013DE5FAF|nr:Ig-like domain-containing protein [Flavobacterium ustbae]
MAIAQCSQPIVGCPNIDLSNFGSDSNTNAATIEYDNFVSSYHATIVRTAEGSLQVWGEKMDSNGTSNVLSPITINQSNFPALGTAVPLKAALGSRSGSDVQGILLATDGLYAWSTEGAVLDETITSGVSFEKLTINGNSNGLPAGVTPGDVKMMFATYKTLAITTCSGDVWVISQTADVRGNGGTGDATTWYRVTTADAQNPYLTDVVVCRGNYDGLMALKSDGTIYVWGSNILIGNNTPIQPSAPRAVQMTLPVMTPKMIASSGNNLLRSYYILATDGNLYTLGENSSRQLGDWTPTDRFSWVQPRYTSGGQIMNNIKWFSVQEHDATYGSVNVINDNKNLYAFGQNDYNLLGTTGNSTNPVMPTGLTVSDKILAVETGGHTSMIVKNCEGNFGYAGHRVRGSMGNGSNENETESVYTFATAPVQICGVESLPAINTVSVGDGPNSKYCVGQPIVLNLTPAGGVLSIVSGPATVTGNTVNFTGAGTVVVQYSISDSCGGVPTLATKTLETAICSADLQITKTVDNLNASVGSNSVFTITATNAGPYKASGVTVSDVLPSGYTFISANPSTGTWSAPDWNIGALANGASATMAITALVNPSGSYSNTAAITGNDTDTDLTNNTATATPVVETDLSITKTADKNNANIGDSITFTITAANFGPSAATAITVNEVLPSGYTFVNATVSQGNWLAPNWTISNLASGASATLSITAIANASGSYANTATIVGMQHDPVVANNTATYTPIVNQLPIAYDDTNAIIPSTAPATAINPLTASDTDGTITNYTIVTLPSHGILALNGIPVTVNQVLTPSEAANLTYDPNGDFTGNDSFDFNATDNSGATSASATITIPVGNNPPTAHSAVNPVIPSPSPATAIIPLTASDTDGTISNYTIVTLPSHGILALNGIPVTVNQVLTPSEAANLTYDPKGDFTGNDSFDFNATDNSGATSASATITIPVGNNPPTAHSAVNPVIPSPAPATAIIPLTASDTDGTISNYMVVTLPSHGILALNEIPITVNQVLTPSEAANLTYDPNGDFTGNDSFDFNATDNSGATSASATITIPVGNNPPTAHSGVNPAIPSPAPATAIIPLTASDTDGTISNYTIVTLPSHGILALNGIPVTVNQVLTPSEAANLTYDPNGDFTGNDSFDFNATDNSGATSASATITIPIGNNPPTAHSAVNPVIPSPAPATAIIPLTASDTDGTIVNYTIITLPSHGILALNGIPVTVNQVLTPSEAANLTYDPKGDFTGNDSFDFNVTDNSRAISASATITIPVGNNPPVAHDAVGAIVPARASAVAINPLTATDTDGTIVNYTIVTLPSHGVLTLNGIAVTVNQVLTPAEAGLLSYDPHGNFSGNDSFTFTATDNNGAIDNTPAIITITIEKTAIIAVEDKKSSVRIDQTVTVLNVLENDSLDNKPIVFSEIILNTLIPDPNGFLVLQPEGNIELAPNVPTGTYSLTYEICEKTNSVNCSSAEVVITVLEPTLTIETDSYCENNTAYVSYTVSGNNFIPTGLLTINWIDSAGKVVATQNNMPLNGKTLWPGMVLNAENNPIDWPGWSLVNNKWIQDNDGFELTKPSVTMEFVLNATQSVSVAYPDSILGCNARPIFEIKAVNDDLLPQDGIIGALEIGNVLDNDILNGSPINRPDVILEGLDFPKGIVLNPDGTIDVEPNTKGGSYTVTYQICETANPTNCSTASITIFVEVPAIAIVKTVQANDTNGNGYMEEGETLTYNFSIQNTGNTDLENIVLDDPLPGIIISGGPIQLAAGQTDSYSFTGTYILSKADINNGSVSNQATVSGITKSGIAVFDKSDPNDFTADNPTIIKLGGCEIVIYNAVSANGDDQNGRFYVKGLECYPENTVQIFNRWGVLVFEREHYNNDDIAFRGVSEGRVTIKDSNGLPEGTYYYIIRYKDRQSLPHQEAGYLYLTK